MIRTLFKLTLVIILLVGVFAFLVGRRSNGWQIGSPVRASGPVDTGKARDAGAHVGEATANVVNRAEDALGEAGITTKIKSKMALDDSVKASNIHVETDGSVVTLTGDVGSETERQRAVQLAKETEGVRSVIDHLRVR